MAQTIRAISFSMLKLVGGYPILGRVSRDRAYYNGSQMGVLTLKTHALFVFMLIAQALATPLCFASAYHQTVSGSIEKILKNPAIKGHLHSLEGANWHLEGIVNVRTNFKNPKHDDHMIYHVRFRYNSGHLSETRVCYSEVGIELGSTLLSVPVEQAEVKLIETNCK